MTQDPRLGADTASASADVEVVADDPIAPIAIAHNCEEVFAGGRLERRDNYLTYVFERDGVRLKARVNLDVPTVVSIYPPNALAPGPLQSVMAPELRASVIAYLQRRFAEIQELSLVAGYETIWRRPAD